MGTMQGQHTGVESLVRVLLALVEAVLLLLLLNLRVGLVDLVASLIDGRGANARVSRHDEYGNV